MGTAIAAVVIVLFLVFFIIAGVLAGFSWFNLRKLMNKKGIKKNVKK